MASEKKQIKFHYIKSNLFRVIHSDGAWGGITPQGEVFFTLFNSRPPIPEILVQAIQENGELGTELSDLTVSKEGIVREVEVGVVMTTENAKALIDFLKGRVEQIEKLKTQIEEQKNK